MNEELKLLVSRLREQGVPQEKINLLINKYMSKQEDLDLNIPDANVIPVSQRDLDDGLKPESYVNSTAWSSSGLDRSIYYDEQGNLLTVNAAGVPFDPLTDVGYSLALKDEERREELIRESEAPEITTTEGLFTVTDKDQENAVNAANATYDSYEALDQPYDSSNLRYETTNYIGAEGASTETVRISTLADGETQVRDVMDPSQRLYYEGLDVVIPGETPRQREARFMSIWLSQGEAMVRNPNLPRPQAFSSSASELTFTAEQYAQWRLGLARDPNNDLYDPYLASNVYDKFEEGTDLNKLYQVEKTLLAIQRLEKETGEKINFTLGEDKVSDFPGLQETIDNISNDDPELKDMIVKSESRINRSNQISQQALELAEQQIEEEKDFPSKPGIANYFFESPEAQEEAAKQAEQDLDFLEADIKIPPK